MNKESNLDKIKELKKRIKFLENKLKQYEDSDDGKDFIDKENLLHKLQEKEVQVEMQKYELIEKQYMLEESRDRYADLFDFAPLGYLTLSKKGIVTNINMTGSAMLGYERKYILNIPFINFLANGEATRFINYLKDCGKSRKAVTGEFTIRTKSNRQLNIEIVTVPIHNYKEKEIDFRVSIFDITEKKKIEDKLKESEERFRIMADSSPAMIWMTDENNNLIYLNKMTRDFYGITSAGISIDEWVNLTHPEDRERMKRKIKKAAGEGKLFYQEVRRKDKNGYYKWILNSSAPRFLNGGKFAGYVGLGIDITERKKNKEEIENSLKEKEILLKEIHHRVKNNLQVISSILSLQAHYLGNKSINEILKGCRNRVLSMSLIHEQLYHTENFLNINFENYLKILTRQLLNSYQNSIAVDFNMDIDKVNFDVETSINLGLILNELITNSLKYAFGGKDKGQINISLKYSENKEDLILKVSDNGSGLPENFNIHELKSLGMEIVRSLSEQLNGELKIFSNGNTVFQIVMHQMEVN